MNATLGQESKKKQPHIQIDTDAGYSRILTCGAPERAEWASTFLENPKPVAKNREYHSYSGHYLGKEILIISHGIGAPGAMICFQELAQVGAQQIIRVGTAGGLQEDSCIGDLVIATSAIRQDGVTALMVPPEFQAEADLSLTERLEIELMGKAGQVRKGKIATSDLFYPGLLGDGLVENAKEGAIAIEMECSALFVLGSLKRIRTAAVLALDGNPLKWKEGVYQPGSNKVSHALENAIVGALRALALNDL